MPNLTKPAVLTAVALAVARYVQRRRGHRTLKAAAKTVTLLRTENERLREENERLRHDPVTGVLLRLAWTDAARVELPGMRDPVMLLLDVNNLKFVNDTHGHAVGDELLRWIVHRLQTLPGPSTLIGRFGGDEFAVLLDLPTGGWKQQLQEAVDTCAVVVGGTSCGAAFGAARPIDVARRDNDGHDDLNAAEAAVRHRLDRVLHAADLAMYRAKQRCRMQGSSTALEFYGGQDGAVPELLSPTAARIRDRSSDRHPPTHSGRAQRES